MDVQMHGRNYQVDDRLREAAEQKVARAARYFDGKGTADIEITEEQNPRLAAERFRIEITAPAAGSIVRVEAASGTADAALDLAAEKFAQQMRKLKDRLISRSRRSEKKHLNALPEQVEETGEPDVPQIVRVKRFVMKPMTAEEAALQMDMLEHDFFFFHSADSDLPSVLYRRRDGAFGLIEPA